MLRARRSKWKVEYDVSLSDCLLFPFSLSPPLFLFAQGAVIGIDDEDDSTFTITVDQKTFHFQGEASPWLILLSYSPPLLLYIVLCECFAFSHAVHLLSRSLSLPFLPFNVLDWFALLPADTHTLASTQSQSMLQASELFLSSSSSSEVGLTYFGKRDLFHCELNRFLWSRRSN